MNLVIPRPSTTGEDVPGLGKVSKTSYQWKTKEILKVKNVYIVLNDISMVRPLWSTQMFKAPVKPRLL